MNSYKRLSDFEREEISRLLAQKCSFREISHHLGRHISTISREVNKAGSNKYVYRSTRAHKRACRNASKRRKKKHKLATDAKLRAYVLAKLRLYWSPEQIAQTLENKYSNNMTMQISPEAIYAYLYVLPRGQLKKELLACLRQKHKRRHYHQTRKKIASQSKIEDMISIEERPKEVESRSVPGHWEGDLIVGRNKQSFLGTLTERTTRTTILVPLKSKRASEVRKAFAKETKKLPEQMRLTLTYDQGLEMAHHKLFTKDTKMKVYFAHPGSPWERGTNENTNGLIRQFFPKGTNFNKVTRREIKKAQVLLNGRPRKSLNWRTPYEVFNELINNVALKT